MTPDLPAGMTTTDKLAQALRTIVDREFTFFDGQMLGASRKITRDEVLTARDALAEYELGARSTEAQPLPEAVEWEMREDGKLVRKDRWQTGMRRIVALLWGNRHEFEVDEVVEAVRALCPAPYNDGDDEVLVRAILAAAPPAAAQPVEPIADGLLQSACARLLANANWQVAGALSPASKRKDFPSNGWASVKLRDLASVRDTLSAASGDSTPPCEPVQGDSIGAPRPEPEAAGQDCHGLDTPERVRFYEHDFYVLSNFSAFTLQWKGHRFDTSEAAYHWEKFSGDSGAAQLTRHFILTAPSAHEAFKIAEHNKPHRRADWDDVKVDIMREILRAKAQQHEYVRRKLLATGDRELVEDSWRDSWWGWGPDRQGLNMLGKLWMEVRAEFRSHLAASQQADRDAE